MAIIGATGPVGGGSGVVTIRGFQNEQFEQAAPYLPGSLVYVLTDTPVDANSIIVDLNGQVQLKDDAWTYDAGTNSVTIVGGDPYTYDQPNIFTIYYPFT